MAGPVERRSRSRERLLLALLLVGAAVAGVGGAVPKLDTSPRLAAVLTGSVVFAGCLISLATTRISAKRDREAAARAKRDEEDHERQEQEQARRHELESLTAYIGPVETADPEVLGVTPSSLAKATTRPGSAERPPYVIRDIDEEIRRRLEVGEIVVLVGPSKSGKSRTAFEAAIRSLGGRTLIAPDRRQLRADSLQRVFDLLSSADMGGTPPVLWLDDLDDYLRAGALSVARVAGWKARYPGLVVALMDANFGEPNAAVVAKVDDAAATLAALGPNVAADKQSRLIVQGILHIYRNAATAAKVGGQSGGAELPHQLELAARAMEILRRRSTAPDLKRCSK